MQFQPHGNTSVAAEGRLVVFRPESGGDAEEIARILDEIRRVLPALAGAAWGALVVLGSDNLLLTPDAEASLRDAAPRLMASGLRALCLCGRPPAELWIVRAQFERVFDGQPLQFTVLAHEAEARGWLAAQLERAG